MSAGASITPVTTRSCRPICPAACRTSNVAPPQPARSSIHDRNRVRPQACTRASARSPPATLSSPTNHWAIKIPTFQMPRARQLPGLRGPDRPSRQSSSRNWLQRTGRHTRTRRTQPTAWLSAGIAQTPGQSSAACPLLHSPTGRVLGLPIAGYGSDHAVPLTSAAIRDRPDSIALLGAQSRSRGTGIFIYGR